jgi:2-polyprenyl-3-methyl-5-hydroxy-6-metoxy-1,4-benzoquinol methylase
MLRCPSCGLEFSHPLASAPDESQIAEIYEDRPQFVGQYIGWFHREFLAANPSPQGTLLDVGCGTGDFVRLSISHGYRATGIDPDSRAIEAGRRFHGGIPLCAMGAAEFFAQNDRQYDVITFFEVLEHLEDPRRFVETVKHHLADRGWIALSVPNNDSPLLGLYRKVTRIIDYPPHHLTRWSKRTMTFLLESAGFEIVRVVTLRPSLADIIPDACRIRLRRLRPERRARVAGLLRLIISPLDALTPRIWHEGRGMFVLARAK